MITEVSFDGFKTQPAPGGLKPGRPTSPALLALSAALEWLQGNRSYTGGKLEP